MKKRWLFLFTLCLVCVLALAGCGGQDTTSPTTDNPTDGEEQQATVDTEPVELLVSAAASMTDCLTELQTMYTEDHSNVTITYNFGSSGSLQQQIEQGAPANIFLSAGQKQMQALVDKDLMVNDSVKDIVENKKDLAIKEIEAAQIPRSLKDVDIAVVNGNYALEAGLKVNKDALATEDADSIGAKTYGNVVAVKKGNEKTDATKALIKALKSDTVKKYINDKYDGAVVPLF